MMSKVRENWEWTAGKRRDVESDWCAENLAV